MKNTAVVFHWWCDNPNIKPFEDSANPVVLAAACVRKNNPDVPIYVIDVSTCRRPDSDWRHFPYKYKFKVLKRDSFLGELVPYFGNLFCFRLLSRVWDVELAMREVVEQNIIFMDSDIFAINPLCPVVGVDDPEYFHANYNNGVWFYNKKARNTKIVFDYWKGIICRAIHDVEFRDEIYRRHPGYNAFLIQDEIIYRCLVQDLPNHVRSVDRMQNYLFYWLTVDPPEVTRQLRGLHCLHFITGKNRHRMFLSIQEIWDQVAPIMDNQDYQMIFGNATESDRMSIADLYQSPKNLKKLYGLLGIDGKESKMFDYMVNNLTNNGSLSLSLL